MGYVRKRYLGRILSVREPWVIPFVIQLMGEYFIQILETAEAHLPALNPELYGRFIRENQALLSYNVSTHDQLLGSPLPTSSQYYKVATDDDVKDFAALNNIKAVSTDNLLELSDSWVRRKSLSFSRAAFCKTSLLMK